MTPERWRRVKELFEAALEQDGPSRPAFVAEAAAGNPGLADEVLRLLASDEKAAAFLSVPAGATIAEPAAGERADSMLGRRVGPYRVQGEIGHGGMGTVYRAVRDDDQYQKQVAIKLIRDGTASRLVVERFRAERQILADLEHPNIARLLDGGTTEEGWPYFAMECVEGEPIDRYCDSRDLSTRERLELFVQVCSAVHHAHQRLVIHRDLKPGNILVTKDGVPKLLDFGIAKLLTAAGEAQTLTGFPLMTPEYASPEQVKAQPITTASDVYSLGVLLYELLARKRPYELRSRSPEEIARVVCQVEAQKPSAVAPRAVSKQLSGDVDVIVLKAIRKEPERRYASVQQLADDVRRHLEGLPVLARKDSWSYRTAKFVRRHKVGVAAAALVALSLLGGIAATARQARIAQVNQARAERRFNDVRRLADSFLFEFHDAIRDLPGSTKAREMVVARALEYLDGLSADAQPDPSLQRELAVAYQRLGDIQGGPGNGNLGDTKGALASYEKAHALRRALASSGDPRDEEGLASLERSLAQLLFMAGDLRRADEFARSASARLERLVAAGGPDVQIALASAYHGRGFLAARNGDEVSAEEWLGKAASAARAYCDSHPADGSARALLARIESDLVERLGRRGEHVRAAKLAQSIRDILERLVADEPHNAGYRRKLVHALNIGSDEMEAAGDLEGANAARRRSLELALALVAADPANLGDRIALSYSEQYLGAGLIHSGQAEEGLDHLRRALRSSAEIIESDPKNAFARTRRAHIQAELGLALDREGRRTAEMCSSLRESAMFWEAPEHEGQAREIRVDLIRAALAACPRPGARAE